MQLPDKYLDSMKELLGEEYEDYLKSFDDARLYGLRVNTKKISVEDFVKICPFKITPIPWIPNGFYYDGDSDKVSRHPYYFAGLYYLQEPSAMTPANVLPVKEGDMVLDLCAAPGGKSTELGAKLNGKGLLVSNDISASRAKALLKNVEVFGIENVLVTCEYPEKLEEKFTGFFDKILVDAPCSGEGMFRKDNKLIKSWISQGPEFFAPIQKNILNAAANMLKEGGYLLYSTCTFSKMEDEDNIAEFLENHNDFTLERIYDYEGFTRAYGMEEAVRIFPHKMQGEGHFVALLHKNGEAYQGSLSKTKPNKYPDEIKEFLKEFEAFDIEGDLLIQGERVYLVPNVLDKLKGLRILRSGLLLGELKKNRFEPSQALAMVINPKDYSTVVDFKADDSTVIKYLKGETIETDTGVLRGKAKNVLITVDGYALGWGRLNGTTIKNKYLPGWRWM